MRVGVTVPIETYGSYELALTRHGLESISLPCIASVAGDIEVLDRVRSHAADADLLFISSSRTISYVWPEGGMPHIRVAAVGSATAKAVQAAGGHVANVGVVGAEALIDQIENSLQDQDVVYPRARGANRQTVERLTKLAKSVRSEIVYTTIAIAPPPDPVDAVLFASPSAVEGWQLSRHFDDMIVGAIGPTTAEALRRRERTPDLISSTPSVNQLAADLSKFLDERGNL